MSQTQKEIQKLFRDHKIIESESKSWYVGKPGTTKNSFSITWSPGSIVLYGEQGNVTLIAAEFSSYENAKKWLSSCSVDEFSATIAHESPENLTYFYEACQLWGKEPHYK